MRGVRGWRQTVVLGALVALVVVTCDAGELPAPEGNNVCDIEPSVLVALPEQLEETSGIATSRAHEGIFWTHNDSGDDPLVYATDASGAIRARVRIAGATNRDWEDMALAPCEPGGDRDCLFIAEIGDNSERYDNVAVYRVPEPDPPGDTVTGTADILRFTYPGGPRDAEGLFVTDAGIHVVSKGRSGAIELFRLPPPYRPGTRAALERVQRLAPPPSSHSAQATAAAFDRDAGRVVVRTYGGLRFFAVDADTLRPMGRPADLVASDQLQGEAVDFVQGDRIVLTGESRGDYPATLAIVRCDPLRARDDTTSGS